MAYKKHVLERSPYICAAGKLFDYTENVAECLKYYSLEDKVNALKHEANICDKKSPFNYKQPTIKNSRNSGVCTNMRTILQQPVKTRFQALISDLKETTYQSYWDKLEGKAKDTIGKLPVNIDPYSTTFGKKVVSDITAKELVSPSKSYDQVFNESEQGHELYKKSHNDYYVSERVNRKYGKSFNPNRVFGETTAYDPRGIWAKCCLNLENKENVTVASKIQTDLQARKIPKLGESHAPNNNEECMCEGHVFGKVEKNSFSISEALSADDSLACHKDMKMYLSHINSLRLDLKKRYNNNLFSFSNFVASLRYYDKNKTGFIPLTTAYEVCTCYKIYFNKQIMESFFNVLEIVKENNIDYVRFVELLNWKVYFPEIRRNCPLEKKYYYDTSYNAAINDYKVIDNSKMDPAGIPSTRNDVPVPMVPNTGCKADLDNLGMDTDAATIINPSIYTSYGLTFFDFFQPRSKDEIRFIFENVGYEFNQESFDVLWNKGCQHDKTGFVCVDTFNNLVQR
ncbi:uncharacterized protein CBL_05606 [Carabus blaptoides fortunei]